MPNTPDFEREPALTIGDIFAKKTLIQPVVAAAVAIVAGILNLTVGDAVIENITTIVIFVAVIWGAVGANQEQGKLANEQAKETRELVYSPHTVETIAAQASVTGSHGIPAHLRTLKSSRKITKETRDRK